MPSCGVDVAARLCITMTNVQRCAASAPAGIACLVRGVVGASDGVDGVAGGCYAPSRSPPATGLHRRLARKRCARRRFNLWNDALSINRRPQPSVLVVGSELDATLRERYPNNTDIVNFTIPSLRSQSGPINKLENRRFHGTVESEIGALVDGAPETSCMQDQV
jgi:hypothetical protein